MAERYPLKHAPSSPDLRPSFPILTIPVPDGLPENPTITSRIVNAWGNPPRFFRAETSHSSRPVLADSNCDGIVSITYEREDAELKVDGAPDSVQKHWHRCGEAYCCKCKEQVVVDLSLLRVELGLEFGIQRIRKVEDGFSAGNVQESW